METGNKYRDKYFRYINMHKSIFFLKEEFIYINNEKTNYHCMIKI